MPELSRPDRYADDRTVPGAFQQHNTVRDHARVLVM